MYNKNPINLCPFLNKKYTIYKKSLIIKSHYISTGLKVVQTSAARIQTKLLYIQMVVSGINHSKNVTQIKMRL